MSVDSEISRLDPAPVELKLSTGVVVSVQRLKTRQFFRLLRILTKGGAEIIQEGLGLTEGMSEEEMVGKLIGLLALSIPQAEIETIQFMQAMVEPHGLIDGRKLSDSAKDHNAKVWDDFHRTLDNPELEDTLDLVEAIIRNEGADLQRLGKRLASMLKVAEKAGQTKPQPEETPPSNDSANLTKMDSSEVSPEPSISLPPSTDGLPIESLI